MRYNIKETCFCGTTPTFELLWAFCATVTTLKGSLSWLFSQG